MPVQIITNCRIAGISACVPQRIAYNKDCKLFDDQAEIEKFISSVGVEQRRVPSSPNLIASDLCCEAAHRLLDDLGWDRSSVELMVFVSQSQDYKLPATACILQDRLNLPKSTMAFDISMGCSGWCYGIGVVGAMIQSGGFHRALLFAAEDQLAIVDPLNKAEVPLFGAAGTCTALEFSPEAPTIWLESGTDGSGYEDIIVRDGGSRHPFSASSLLYCSDEHGNQHRGMGLSMNGANVFAFGITRAPRAIKNILSTAHATVGDTDYFLVHQANLMMNEKIRKKCLIPEEKHPYSLREFGNCSSASIPLTIVTRIAEQIRSAPQRICACAFGVGLSWGALYTTLQQPVIPPLIEI